MTVTVPVFDAIILTVFLIGAGYTLGFSVAESQAFEREMAEQDRRWKIAMERLDAKLKKDAPP